jgi:hypothetical protein
MPQEQVDFFISYNDADRYWAAGIGNWLDQALYTSVLQSQDFVAGSNFVSEMNVALVKAKRVIAVISPEYFAAPFPESEWTAAFARDPSGSERSLILVRVRECEIPPLLAPLVYIDLVDQDQNAARDHFLAEIKATLANVRTPTGTRARKGKPARAPRQAKPGIHQEIHGNGNTQTINTFSEPPKIKTVLERREGSLSPAECRQVQAWIEELADGTIGMPRAQAFKKWWGHFKSAFGVPKYEDLQSSQMGAAKRWFNIQRSEQTEGLKSKAPDLWQNKKIGSIKGAMKRMGVTNEEYYPRVAARLKMKKPFTSLKKLTKRDLTRVCNMALRDARGS